MRSVCVFCGASSGHDPAYALAARRFGEVLAQRGIELVWGAGNVGLMGVLADAVLSHGGRAVGVIPDFMVERELAHTAASEILMVDSMHARKAAMAERADAFVALPGGFGTLDELFEILTWAQLHIHSKPIGLLNVQGFFDPLLAMVRHMSREGFITARHLALLHEDVHADSLLDAMRRYQPEAGDWVRQKIG